MLNGSVLARPALPYWKNLLLKLAASGLRLVPIYPKYLVTRLTQFDPTALLIEFMHKKGEGELKL